MPQAPIPFKYIAFCDVLGFSSAVLSDFDATMALYENFRRHVREWPFDPKAQVSVYSDSILVVADELPTVVRTVVSLNWAAFLQDWLLRGGISYGRYWEDKEGGNLFVVSDALVKAVSLEKTVKVPAVVISEEISLGIEAWVPRFEHGATNTPLLHFQGRSLVNPFNPYWFSSAIIRAKRLLVAHPAHREKYEWFLSLADAVARDELLVPDSALNRMLELGILHRRQDDTASPLAPSAG